MSMIDPDAPIYTFTYEPIEKRLFKYVKDQNRKIHRIKLTEYITAHNSSNREKGYIYASYKVEVINPTQSKSKRILNVIFDRKDIVSRCWIDIKSEFYTRDFYSEFSPTGLVALGDVYDTYEAAQTGRASYIFRDYNLKVRK